MPSVVSLHPERALLLAAALGHAATDLADCSRRLALLLAGAGETLAPAAEVARAATTLAAEERRLRRIVAEVAAWEAEGVRPASVRVLVGPVSPSHRDPGPAVAQAGAVAAAVRRDGLDALVAVAPRWREDPVFAGALLAELGSTAVVEELASVASSWGGADGAHSRHLAVVAVLAQVLATTTRAGAPALPVADLVRAAEAGGHRPAVVGFLFLQEASWAPDYLAAVVDQVVVPVSREVAVSGPLAGAWFGSSGAGVDPRVLVLSAVARQPAAAHAVVAGSDLRALLDQRAELLDGGVALAEVLVQGLTPATPAEVPVLAPAVVRVVEVVADLGDRGRLAPRMLPPLGAVAATWIGGLGTTPIAPAGVPPLLPGLACPTAGRFLRVVVADARAAVAVEAGATAWARGVLGRIDADADPLLTKHVADVLSAVDAARRDVHLDDLLRRDADADRWRSLAGGALDLLTTPVKGTPVAQAGAVVVGTGAEHLLDRYMLPPGDKVAGYAGAAPALLAEDRLAVQHLVAATLWANRSTNGLFGPAVGPLPAGQARPVDPVLLDAAGRFRPLATLSAQERAAFVRWLLAQDEGRTTLATHLNAAAAHYATPCPPAG